MVKSENMTTTATVVINMENTDLKTVTLTGVVAVITGTDIVTMTRPKLVVRE